MNNEYRHPHQAGSGKYAGSQAGAGLAADSDPARGYQETQSEAQVLVAAIELAKK